MRLTVSIRQETYIMRQGMPLYCQAAFSDAPSDPPQSLRFNSGLCKFIYLLTYLLTYLLQPQAVNDSTATVVTVTSLITEGEGLVLRSQ